MDKQELKLSKKLVSSYKKRLEKEIIERSIKLKNFIFLSIYSRAVQIKIIKFQNKRNAS